jgi:hypothetical protein
VAHLDQIVTAEKAVVARWQRQAGCQTDEERRRFATALERKRGRFAFPDDFVAAFQPLRKRLANWGGENSLESIMIDALREIRVQAEPSWDAGRPILTFFFIRESDAGLDDDIWQRQASDWCALIELSTRYNEVFPQVIELGDMSASDYVASVPLDL